MAPIKVKAPFRIVKETAQDGNGVIYSLLAWAGKKVKVTQFRVPR